MTPIELKEHYQHKVITSVMTAQILQNQLHELTVLGIFNKKYKQHINNALKALQSIEVEHYDTYYKNEDERTSEIYDFYEKFIKLVSKMPIYDAAVILSLYRIYKDTPKKLQTLIYDNYESEYLKKIEAELQDR